MPTAPEKAPTPDPGLLERRRVGVSRNGRRCCQDAVCCGVSAALRHLAMGSSRFPYHGRSESTESATFDGFLWLVWANCPTRAALASLAETGRRSGLCHLGRPSARPGVFGNRPVPRDGTRPSGRGTPCPCGSGRGRPSSAREHGKALPGEPDRAFREPDVETTDSVFHDGSIARSRP